MRSSRDGGLLGLWLLGGARRQLRRSLLRKRVHEAPLPSVVLRGRAELAADGVLLAAHARKRGAASRAVRAFTGHPSLG